MARSAARSCSARPTSSTCRPAESAAVGSVSRRRGGAPLAHEFPRYVLSGAAFPGRPPLELAQEARALGLDAVDLVAARGGQVDCAQPRGLVEACAACADLGVAVTMVTTDLTSPFDDHADAVHAACAEAGIPYIRYGAWARLGERSFHDSLKTAQAGLRGLETLCRRWNLRALIRQTPGSLQAQAGYAAALLQHRRPGFVGACLAPGEVWPLGLEGWRLDLDALGDYVQALSVTNSTLVHANGRWTRTPAPLADGVADWSALLDEVTRRGLDVFALLESRYADGPVWRAERAAPAPADSRLARELLRRDLEAVRQRLGARPVRRASNKPRRWYRPR